MSIGFNGYTLQECLDSFQLTQKTKSQIVS